MMTDADLLTALGAVDCTIGHLTATHGTMPWCHTHQQQPHADATRCDVLLALLTGARWGLLHGGTTSTPPFGAAPYSLLD